MGFGLHRFDARFCRLLHVEPHPLSHRFGQGNNESNEQFVDAVLLSDSSLFLVLLLFGVLVSEFSFKIFAPRTLHDLIKIKTRVRFGNMEVAKKYPSMKIGQDNAPLDILKLCASTPSMLLKSLVYIYVQFRTKQLSKKRMAAADFTTWERDESSRT